MSIVDATIQATIDGLKKVVSDAEAKSAPLREEMTALRQRIIDAEGEDAEKARQKLRQLGVPAFSDWQRPLLRSMPAPGGPKDAPKPSGGSSPPAFPNKPVPGPAKGRK